MAKCAGETLYEIMPAVSRRFCATTEVRASLQMAVKSGGYAYNDALHVAQAERVPMIVPRAGDEWRLDDGVTLTFIGPSLPFIQSNNTINDNSLAFILQYKHFPNAVYRRRRRCRGTALHKRGYRLACRCAQGRPPWLCVQQCPAFISEIHPRYAIISVGRHNMFGHPAPATLETLSRFGARIYRTDGKGAVMVYTDGVVTSVSSTEVSEMRP